MGFRETHNRTHIALIVNFSRSLEDHKTHLFLRITTHTTGGEHREKIVAFWRSLSNAERKESSNVRFPRNLSGLLAAHTVTFRFRKQLKATRNLLTRWDQFFMFDTRACGHFCKVDGNSLNNKKSLKFACFRTFLWHTWVNWSEKLLIINKQIINSKMRQEGSERGAMSNELLMHDCRNRLV